MFAFWPHQEISTPTVIGLKTTFVLNALKDPISMTITSANKLVPTVKKLVMDIVPLVMTATELKMELVSDLMTKEISSAPNGITTFVLHVPSELTSTTTENVNPSPINAKFSTMRITSVQDAIKDMN